MRPCVCRREPVSCSLVGSFLKKIGFFLIWVEVAYKPSSVPLSINRGGDHFSKRPDPRATNGPPVERGLPLSCPPIWSCSGWGLPCLRCRHQSGELLPRLFTLTEIFGGIFSVALSLGLPPVAVSDHPAQWSSDFPPLAQNCKFILNDCVLGYFAPHRTGYTLRSQNHLRSCISGDFAIFPRRAITRPLRPRYSIPFFFCLSSASFASASASLFSSLGICEIDACGYSM